MWKQKSQSCGILFSFLCVLSSVDLELKVHYQKYISASHISETLPFQIHVHVASAIITGCGHFMVTSGRESAFIEHYIVTNYCLHGSYAAQNPDSCDCGRPHLPLSHAPTC